MKKFTKISGIEMSDMYLVRDCPREEIWRRRHYITYKANRDTTAPSKYGKWIKFLNEKMRDKYKQVFRIDNAEADDVIAVLVAVFRAIYPDKCIYIVANDSDYNQLLKYRNVHIYNPKGWKQVTDDDPLANLQRKILRGDSSDNIRAARTELDKLRNSQLIDMDYIPRTIQNRVITQLKLSPTLIPSNFRPKSVQLGLCCINTILRKDNVFCSRKMIIRTIKEKGIGEQNRRSLLNCEDLIRMIKWNAENGIRVMRISSEIFPHMSNDRVDSYTLDFADKILKEAGALARSFKQRLTFHPGQYNVIASPTLKFFENTVKDLDWHAEVLDRMGCDQDSVMVIHAGGHYGDKEATKERWCQRFKTLPERVQRRLVLENCEKSFSVVDCLEVSAICNIPVVFDTHHFNCYKKLHPEERFEPAEFYIPKILETWHRRGIKPKFHVSEQAAEGKIGKHSDYIETLPKYLLDIDCDIDIMIEAKMKEQAIFKLYKKYPELDPRIQSSLTPLVPLRIKPTVKPKTTKIRIKIGYKKKKKYTR